MAPIKPGQFRWKVKTLQDPAAAKISFATSVNLDLSKISLLHNPGVTQKSIGLPRGVRGKGPEEFKVYKFSGQAKAFKLEQDGDYHLLIDDGKGRRINVELPNPDPKFVGASIKKAEMAKARADFEKIIGKSTQPSINYKTVDVKVTVTGVGFWDEPHGQGGIGNGFELHPILSIR